MFDRLSHVYQSLLWASFVLFVTTALSASFGVAAYSVSLGVLAILSFGSVFAWRAWRLLGVERLGLALLIWLCAREVIESGTGGLLTVLSEYRLFWVAPLIAVALNRWIEPQNILVPVVVALGIYFIGSVSLTLLDDPFLISEQKRVIQGNGGPHLSLGGKFVFVEDAENLETEGGYAKEASEDFKKKQEELIKETVKKQDIIICTALIPGKKAPRIITEEMVLSMKPGSIICDLAAAQGGNSAFSEPDKVVDKNGIKIIGYTNIASRISETASNLLAKNIYNFIDLIYDKENKTIKIDKQDEIIKSVLMNGEQ